MVSQTNVRQVSDKDFPTLKRYSLVVDIILLWYLRPMFVR